MFDKILIANRGEIACRIIDTARLMGVQTVAVYSYADAQARHVATADEAVHIGGSKPADSYLRGDAIIAAALETGAQAIHPGYGFLSENPDFVEKVVAAGLTFVGPSASAIRAMGLKDAAKKLMENAGVPVVPGYHGVNQNGDHLQEQAEAIGFPVLIKAVAGGGGKGMRRVDAVADFAHALESARAEASGAFGNDAVLIEKYIEKPRHIEIQVFGDGQKTVHLFERDCSLQRRHQKVIEEAPAPGMTPEMRAAMGAAAVSAAEAIGYKGAGTIEFIVDASDGLQTDRFWFMEMNTRLQVEHPVTEAVTGVDLVEWQLRVASGECLPKVQSQLELNGHSVEARLYAEDVPAGFLPATGTLSHLKFSPQARADTGVSSGDVISPYYDPMIAKIVVHGPTRAIALSQLSSAIDETEVAGTVTNLTFLGNLAKHAGFRDGDVDTGLIERDLAQLTRSEAAPGWVKSLAVLACAGLTEEKPWATGFTLWESLRRTVKLVHDEVEFSATLLVHSPDLATVELPEGSFEMIRQNTSWQHAGKMRKSRAERIGQSVSVFAGGTWHFDIPDPLKMIASGELGGDVVVSPMPGLVKSVFAASGQTVVAGERLVILEAMKMEHTLTAPRDGEIDEVMTCDGAQVEAGTALVQLVKAEKEQ